MEFMACPTMPSLGPLALGADILRDVVVGGEDLGKVFELRM